MLYVICDMLYVICYMLYVICYMLYVICYMLYAICYMLYVICYMLRPDVKINLYDKTRVIIYLHTLYKGCASAGWQDGKESTGSVFGQGDGGPSLWSA